MALVSKCVICRQDIDINFNLTKSTGKEKQDQKAKAKKDQNQDDGDETVLEQETNDRLVFQTFCRYFNLSSSRWTRLWDDFHGGNGGNCSPRKNMKFQGKNGKRKNTRTSRTQDDIEYDIPTPFCSDCKSVVSSLCDLDKMLLMVRSEISKLVTGILNIVLSHKDHNTQADLLKIQTMNNKNSPVDVDQILACEIVRLRNSIFEQYTPRLIINDLYKSPTSLESQVEESSTPKIDENEPLHSFNKRRRIASTRKEASSSSNSSSSKIKNEIEIVLPNYEQPPSPSTNSKSPPEIDDYYDDFQPASPPTHVNFETKIVLQVEDQKKILPNNNHNRSKSPNKMKTKPADKLDEEEIIAHDSQDYIDCDYMDVDIKVEPSTSENREETLNITNSIEPEPESSISSSSSRTKSPRKAKNDALAKIKQNQKVEELQSLDIVIDISHEQVKSDPVPPPPPQVLDEIALDSDEESVNIDDNDDDSEYNSHSENNSLEDDDDEEEEDKSNPDPKPSPKRGRPAGSPNKPKSKEAVDANPDVDKSQPLTRRKRIRKKPVKDDDDDTRGPAQIYKNHKYRTILSGDGEPVECQCANCPFSTDSLDKLFAHIDQRHLVRYLECPLCPENNIPRKHNIRSFNMHMARKHRDEIDTAGKVISCRNGFYIYNKKWTFKKTEDGSFHCWECDEIVEKSLPATSTNATEVVQEQPTENPVVEESKTEGTETSGVKEGQPAEQNSGQDQPAEECEKEKGSEIVIPHENSEELKNIMAHIQSEHIAESHLCEICAKVSHSKKLFETHKLIHTLEKPYICEFCAMRFRSLNRLNRHTPVHTDQLSFICQVNTAKGICGRKFKLKRYLDQHLNSNFHHEGKSFECPHCLESGVIKKFHLIKSLQRHVKNHLIQREKTKCCPDCNKAFYTNSEVRQHLIRCPVLLGLVPKPSGENGEDKDGEDEEQSGNLSEAGAEEANINTSSVTTNTTSSTVTTDSNLNGTVQNSESQIINTDEPMILLDL